MENRLAIAQIINLTDSHQLGNLAQAINFVNRNEKAYSFTDKKKKGQSRLQSADGLK
jgi:hypothetical protein